MIGRWEIASTAVDVRPLAGIARPGGGLHRTPPRARSIASRDRAAAAAPRSWPTSFRSAAATSAKAATGLAERAEQRLSAVDVRIAGERRRPRAGVDPRTRAAGRGAVPADLLHGEIELQPAVGIET